MTTTNSGSLAANSNAIPFDWQQRAQDAARARYKRYPGDIIGARQAALRALPQCAANSVVYAAIAVVGGVAADYSCDGYKPIELCTNAEAAEHIMYARLTAREQRRLMRQDFSTRVAVQHGAAR